MGRILIYNGEVITVNKQNEIAQAIIMEGKRIIFVGSDEEALRLCDEATEKIDAGGKSVLPGFIETHIHLGSKFVISKGVDVSKKSGIHNIRDLQDRLRETAAQMEKGSWVICHGLTFEDLDERRWPTRWELDEACKDYPVAITHSSGHTGLYNTLAMELCHVFDKEVDYPDEHVVKDEKGEVNGVLKETAHFICSEIVSSYNPITEEALKEYLCEVVEKLNSVGITTAHDAGATGTALINAMQKLVKDRKLTCRMYPMLFSILGKDDNIDFCNAQIRSGFFTGLGDDYMKIGPLKLMIDGSGASGTCATREPMSHNGAMMPTSMTKEEVEDIVIRAHKAGFQITAHCIGDRAVEMLLDIYDKAQDLYPRKDCRHRIEHCMLAEPDLIKRIAGLGAIPTFNPAFINLWGISFNKYYQGKRNDYLIPLKSALDAGVVCTTASDWECCADIRPIQGIASAMDRTVYENGEKVAPVQAIGLMDAIRCYTYNGAYSSFEEDKKGSLEAGKLADVIVLDGKITEKTPREISEMSVEKTFFDGKLVYSKQAEVSG